MGYHKKQIKRGELGKFSKIREEFEELSDAVDQNNPVLIICELTDLIGSIESYARAYNLTLEHLIKFSNCTKEAFLEGKR